MSDNLLPFRQSDAEMRAQLDDLKFGGGGGTYDGMEPRIAKLEARADGIEKRLDDIKTDIGRVETRLISMADTQSAKWDAFAKNQLTKWDMAQVVVYLIGAMAAAAVLVPRIAKLLV